MIFIITRLVVAPYKLHFLIDKKTWDVDTNEASIYLFRDYNNDRIIDVFIKNDPIAVVDLTEDRKVNVDFT